MKQFNAVIGGAGFVGSRLADVFERLCVDYRLFDIKAKFNHSDITYLDVEDVNSLDSLNGSSCFINLAAVHKDDVRPISRYDDVNVQGAINLCNQARKLDVKKIIFTSSVAVYGSAPVNTDESGAINFSNDYGRTKYEAEKVYKAWQSEDPEGRLLVIIRPTVIFGEGNRGNVYNLFNQIASKRFVMIGNGKNIKSMAYVENVALFLNTALTFPPGQHIYNYVDKPDLNMNELVSLTRNILFKKNNVGLSLPASIGKFLGLLSDLLAYLTGKSLPVSSIRVKKFQDTTQFLSSAHETGYKPSVSLEEGIMKTLTYEFIEDNSSANTFETE